MKPGVLDNGTMTDPVLKTRNCRWIAVPGASDARGHVNFLELGKGLDFTPRRLFWLHHIAPGQWRGRHGHLDDGKCQETVRLDDPARALQVGTWVWHELTDFAPQSVIVVIASTLYDEAEYLRDYEVFKREAAGRP